jgi:hypothetical protein
MIHTLQVPIHMEETNTRLEPNRAIKRKRMNKMRKGLYHETVRRYKRWTLSPAAQSEVDKRLSSFGEGTKEFMPATTRFMEHTTRQKSIVWNHLVQSGVLIHCYKGLLPEPEYKVFEDLCDLLMTIFNTTSDVQSTMSQERARGQKTTALTLRSIEVLTDLERLLPCTRFAPTLHNVRHFATCIHRWNNVRCYWAFAMER